jgi:uncharacterized membrane protein
MADEGAAPSPAPGLLRGKGLRSIRSRGLEQALLVAGAVLLNAMAIELALLGLIERSMGLGMWRAVGVEMLLGREAAIPVALQSGAPRWLVAQVSATQDIGVFLLAYPLFLRLMARPVARKGWLRVRLEKVQADADEHRGIVHRWGGLGVFLFMLVPFLVNGPLVGGIAGRLAGLRTTDVLLPVVASTTIAAFAWTYFYDAVLGLASGVHPALPYILTIVIVGGLLGTLVLKETLEMRRARKGVD